MQLHGHSPSKSRSRGSRGGWWSGSSCCRIRGDRRGEVRLGDWSSGEGFSVVIRHWLLCLHRVCCNLLFNSVGDDQLAYIMFPLKPSLPLILYPFTPLYLHHFISSKVIGFPNLHCPRCCLSIWIFLLWITCEHASRTQIEWVTKERLVTFTHNTSEP